MIATEWKTLVLNKDWRPISIVPALKAVTKVFNGRALFINPETHCLFEWEDWILEWEDAIRTAKIDESRVMPLASWKLLLPEIIVCTEYRGYGSRTNNGQSPKFSRRNLFLRDRNTCFAAGTMVLMADGRQAPIESISVGDKVVDAYGNPQKVVAIGNRWAEDVVSMKYRGSQISTLVTKDHPFLSSVGDYKPIGDWNVIEGSQRGEGDYLVCPRSVHYDVSDVGVIDVSKFFPGRWFRYRDGRLFWSKRSHEPGFPAFLKTSPDLAYLMGLYCAEGSTSNRNVTWSLHDKETDTLAADIQRIVEFLGLNVNIGGPAEDGHGIVVRTCSKTLAGILSQTCGVGAYNKHTPWELIGSYRKEFLRGLLLGDGYIAEKFDKVSFNVASYHLVMDVQAIALGMGIHATLQAGERPDGRRYWSAIFQGDNYVRLMNEVLDRDVQKTDAEVSFGNDQFVFRKLKSVVDADPCVVHNIEVDGTHSYIANGVSVHNCQFCGKKFPSDDMTMDHVIPKSKGGKTDWYNIVLACVACNRNKADKSLKDSGMKLIRRPYHPTAEELRLTPADRIRMQIISRPPKTWEQFLGKMLSEMYWRVELLP